MTETESNRKLATEIVKHLGEGRVGFVCDRWFVIILEDGERDSAPQKGYNFSFQRGLIRDPGRWEITGHWPRDVNGNEHRPNNKLKITVSAARSAADIVSDLTRRLKGEYEIFHARMADAVDNANEHAVNLHKNIKAVSDALEYIPTAREMRLARLETFTDRGIDRVEVSYDGCQVLTDDLTIGQTLELIAFLRNLTQKG